MAGLRLPRTWRQRVGLGTVALGLALAGASGGYYLYSQQAVAKLDRLVVRTGAPLESLPEEWRAAQSGDPLAPSAARRTDGAAPPTRFGIKQAVEPATTPSASVPASISELVFRWADWNSLPKTLGQAPKATRLVIPAIGVDSPIVEVEIVWDGEKQVWQRPKQSVGHHVGTANPGEVGNVVLSGHINSPVRGEGSVFKRLPEIPERMRSGEAVEAYVSSEDKTYIYRIVQNEVVEPDDVEPFDPTSRPTLTIITCVPDLVFTQRLIVTGLLVKIADGGFPSAGQRVEGAVVSPGR